MPGPSRRSRRASGGASIACSTSPSSWAPAASPRPASRPPTIAPSAIEKCQQGYAVGGEALYNDISKGMSRDVPSFDDEEQMRCFWREWDRRIAAAEG